MGRPVSTPQLPIQLPIVAKPFAALLALPASLPGFVSKFSRNSNQVEMKRYASALSRSYVMRNLSLLFARVSSTIERHLSCSRIAVRMRKNIERKEMNMRKISIFFCISRLNDSGYCRQHRHHIRVVFRLPGKRRLIAALLIEGPPRAGWPEVAPGGRLAARKGTQLAAVRRFRTANGH